MEGEANLKSLRVYIFRLCSGLRAGCLNACEFKAHIMNGCMDESRNDGSIVGGMGVDIPKGDE